ncbi:tetratricopeptide repeat protein [Kitasatospora sp. NPDC008050]|uniref:tetratricopeptide repeat protein n=1 Tax=Kitasatospora sp. NPDC008050 TaxID=3364021 RepID=UPI0036EF1683
MDGGPDGTVGRYGNTVAGQAWIGGSLQARDVHGTVNLNGALSRETLPVPRQLPAVPLPVLGRESELADLDTLFEAAVPLVALTGPVGVGKSALALCWSHRRASAFPDGQLYADLRLRADGPVDPAQPLAAFLRAFGVTAVPADLAEGAALWRSLAAERRLLLLLEDVLTADQITPLLPGSGGSLVIVTSRRRLTGLGAAGAARRPLGPLSREALTAILAARIGPSRVSAEPQAVHHIVGWCAGVPLLAGAVAARVEGRPGLVIATATRELEQRGGRLAAFDRMSGHVLRRALDDSCRLLSPEAAGLYRMLGLLPFADFTGDDAHAVSLIAAERLPAVLEELLEAGLAEELGAGRYRCSALVRLHARACVDEKETPGVQYEALCRLLDWYLATASAAEALLTPTHRNLRRDYVAPVPQPPFDQADPHGALDWLDRERHHLMRLVEVAAATGHDTVAWQLVDAMWPLFLRLRPYDLWIAAHELGLAAARRQGDQAAEARMLTSAGVGLYSVGRVGEATNRFTQALELARARADRRDEAQAWHGLGQSHRIAGRLAEAERCFHQALRLRLSIGYARGAALTRLSLAELLLAKGRPAEAVPGLLAAHDAFIELDDQYEAARALGHLGRAQRESDLPAEAEETLLRALDYFRETGSRHWQASILEELGQAVQARGRLSEALLRYRQSLDYFAEAGGDQELYQPDQQRLRQRIRMVEARSADATGPG